MTSVGPVAIDLVYMSSRLQCAHITTARTISADQMVAITGHESVTFSQ